MRQQRSMNTRSWLIAILALLLLASAAGGVVAAPDATTLVRAVFGSAGQPVAAGDIVLNGTLGEAVAGPLVTAADVQEGSGYWQKLPEMLSLYLPQVRK